MSCDGTGGSRWPGAALWLLTTQHCREPTVWGLPEHKQTHTGGGAGSWRARSPCKHRKESSGASLEAGGPTVAGSGVLCLLPETLLQTQIHFLSIKKGVKLRGLILFYSRTMQYL